MIHARDDYSRIQDPAGLIPEDMPVFLLLGKDKHAARTVRFWADAVEADGGDPEIVRLARAHADKMDALPSHKQPDLAAKPASLVDIGRKLGVVFTPGEASPCFDEAFAADIERGADYAEALERHITGGNKIRRAACLQTLQALADLTPSQVQDVTTWAKMQRY